MFKTNKAEEFYNRLYHFARDCALAVRELPRTSSNQIYSRQLIRSSSSISANYLEAQEALGRKDFLYRLSVCRKESKETIQWIRLILDTNSGETAVFKRLFQEATEFVLIFGKSIGTTRARSTSK
jgi:four helix bundle protein